MNIQYGAYGRPRRQSGELLRGSSSSQPGRFGQSMYSTNVHSSDVYYIPLDATSSHIEEVVCTKTNSFHYLPTEKFCSLTIHLVFQCLAWFMSGNLLLCIQRLKPVQTQYYMCSHFRQSSISYTAWTPTDIFYLLLYMANTTQGRKLCCWCV